MDTTGRLVAARFVDGRVTKGWTSDFRPTRDLFRVNTPDEGEPTRIRVSDLKALFFIKTLEGNPDHEERKSFEASSGVWNRFWIEFACDGEQLAGWSSSHLAGKQGLFLVPTDADSNISRVWIPWSATREVLRGSDAEEAARRYAQAERSRGPIAEKSEPTEGPEASDSGVYGRKYRLTAAAIDRFLQTPGSGR